MQLQNKEDSKRTVTVTIRLSKKEVAAWDDLKETKQLVTRSNVSRADTLVSAINYVNGGLFL
jgi:hypothetical protein